jgi:hypothetical protein
MRPEPAAAKPVFTQPTASAIPPRMPAPDWDEHPLDASNTRREDDGDVIAPPPPPAAKQFDSMLPERERAEPAPFDTLVSEPEQPFEEVVDASFDPKRIVTSPGVGPAKPAKIPHTNPHASPPPPLQLGAPCPTCGSSSPVDAKFCARCGTTIGERVSQAAMATPIGAAMQAPMMMPPPGPGPTPVAKAKTMMADPNIAAAQPPPDERSPWAPPGEVTSAPVQSGLAQIASHSAPVSPFAPTVPSEIYQPKPGDPLYEAKPDTPKQSHPNAPRSRSILPILLVVVGVVIVVAVIVAWMLR